MNDLVSFMRWYFDNDAALLLTMFTITNSVCVFAIMLLIGGKIREVMPEFNDPGTRVLVIITWSFIATLCGFASALFLLSETGMLSQLLNF